MSICVGVEATTCIWYVESEIDLGTCVEVTWLWQAFPTLFPYIHGGIEGLVVAEVMPVTFFSKKLTPSEALYHVTDREFIAIFKACMKWRHYLHGAKCAIYTNHKSLKYIYVQPHLNTHQAGWLERLAELDLHIVYKPGVENVAADVLSWYGCHVEQMGDISSVRHSISVV